MKKTKRLWALLLVMVMALGLITTAFAAPTIDSGRKASLSLYKYDITAASADGVWDAASYVSTGVQDDAVTDKLAQYAIQGVEFSYLRVASISTYSQRENGQYKVGVLYGFADDAVLQAIGLTKADAYKRGNGVFYFTSDKLNKALADALADNATTVKNALEIAVRNGGKAMPETDANGHSKVNGLEQGLYLVVEARVPENVISTCNPFFVSLPMTTIDGKDWNYDVTVYPKNQTGSPDLEKTVREDKNSTGKNTGSLTDIADGYAHTATASVGDVVDYQIISTLPTITSKATSLTTYTFVDTLREGIRYNRSDVVIEFFRDAGCTDPITAWDEDSGKFAVSYDDAANTMTIGMTETGLADINESESVYTGSVKRGYASKYALSERLVCGECGTLYRRCTWTRNGEKRIVWRCVSRLDYGKKYCHNSPTLDEAPLQQAILAALNKAMADKNSLIRQITDAMETEIIPFPGGTMSLGDIERRLRELEQQFQTLLEKATDDPAAYGGQFKEILDEQTLLKERRSGILADNKKQAKANQRIMDAAQTLENASPYITEWDESAVRQLVETVKILSKDEVAVTLKGGIELCQKIMY